MCSTGRTPFSCPLAVEELMTIFAPNQSAVAAASVFKRLRFG